VANHGQLSSLFDATVDGIFHLAAVVSLTAAAHKLASSFASGIIREPLAGVRAICPVEADTLLWLTSRCQLIASLLHSYELPAAAWSTERSLILPGITVRVRDMVEVVETRPSS
jgi:hypothetical protein